jgi:hypothetical protein
MTTVESAPPDSPAKVDGDPPPPGNIKNLLSSWEKRASFSAGAPAPDVARLAVSPRGVYKKKVSPKPQTIQPDGSSVEHKSTRQTMEDLSIFVSPREIKKKLVVAPKQSSASSSSSSSSSETRNKETQATDKVVTPTTKKATLKNFPSPPQQEAAVASSTHTKEMPMVGGSIRDRMKAFERKHDAEHTDAGQAPWMQSQGLRGKRGSTLGKFTPKPTAKANVLSRRKEKKEDAEQNEPPKNNLLRQDTEEEKKASTAPSKDQNEEPRGHDEEVAASAEMSAAKLIGEEDISSLPVTDKGPTEEQVSITEPSDQEKMASSIPSEGSAQHPQNEYRTEESAPAANLVEEEAFPLVVTTEKVRIDRDTLVLEEIRKMIRDTEDNEIEDDMDEEVKEVLEKAALESPAYTKRWYDAIADSWIHCPSLATLISDYSLLEAAEELYGEELPMLYTVSLRAVASEVMTGEEELPEYVYRLAS